MKTPNADVPVADGATTPESPPDDKRDPLGLDPLSPTATSLSESEQATLRAGPLSLNPLSPILTIR
jgi:hypothetical protein